MTDLVSITKPDQDLVDDLVATVNRHADRMAAGTVFGSLLTVASAAIHSENLARKPSPAAITGLCQIAVHFLAKPHKPADPKTVLHLR